MTLASPLLVVLDTNVLIAAGFNRRSSSARLVEAAATGKIRMVWNEEIRRELQTTIARIPGLEWTDFENLMRQEPRAESLDLSEAGLEAIVDPADRKFVALARATHAILVTSDRHLLSVRNHLSTVICTPSELIRELAFK